MMENSDSLRFFYREMFTCNYYCDNFTSTDCRLYGDGTV